MRFSSNSKALDHLWGLADEVDVTQLKGLWHVEMMTGKLPDLSRLNHRKFFFDMGKGRKGHNIITLRREHVWGRFAVHTGIGDIEYAIALSPIGRGQPVDSSQVEFLERATYLIYERHGIVDQIKQLHPQLMIGKFYWHGKFLGYFFLHFRIPYEEGKS